jgi:hypothetical protein
MLRRLSLVIAVLAGFAPAAAAQTGSLRPAATSTVGPWEIVVWVAGTRVQQCTLVRAAPAAGEPMFGILIDSQGGVLSVDTPAWTLAPKVPVAATLAPSAGTARRMTVEAVSPTRANIRFAPESPLLEQLQRSDYFELRVGTAAVRVGVDEFNAARVVLDICVQKVGTRWQSAPDN